MSDRSASVWLILRVRAACANGRRPTRSTYPAGALDAAPPADPATGQRERCSEARSCLIRSRLRHQVCLFPDQMSVAGRRAISENMQRAETAAGGGARTGPISQGSQHHPLLAAEGGPLSEVIEAAEHAIRIDPNRNADGNGLQRAGRVQEHTQGMPRRNWRLQTQRDQLDPRGPGSCRYRHIRLSQL